MKKIAYWLYQPYKLLFFLPVFAVSSLLFSFLAAGFSMIVNPKAGSFWGATWARVTGYMTPIFVNVSGRHHIDKKQSYVIVANHQSGYDIFVLYGWLGIDFKWIMKKELRQAPGIGYASHKVGHIFLDRSSPRAAMESIEEAKKKLKNGTSVVIFPEGTRSGSNQMKQFKKGAFKVAFELGLPILPITLIDTYKVYKKGLNLLPGSVQMVIHQPIDTSAYLEQENELLKLTHSTIQSALV
ncbi:lysophospholipid acyltransferase family protein [Carboxylicivirga marina]|uniref:1-acyl-sn-glycerol-3-phosphate acyltransferase n=1 Tax=Carboxylicivirga marina TaxID=2800988 RepID=A0ABS1HLD4_9BACT|nr:lysophospholipid acyltransferase family protein [Carboxylicivirga marina]MBK3518489.1 1-acyl-sn-glycerol-3-phosphate acyltransferase [Carboxylicivirga marina]